MIAIFDESDDIYEMFFCVSNTVVYDERKRYNFRIEKALPLGNAKLVYELTIAIQYRHNQRYNQYLLELLFRRCDLQNLLVYLKLIV